MIAILDYDAGNIKSVEKAVHYLGEEAVITRDKDLILSCDKVILPGVGSFGDAMGKLREYKLDQVIYDVVDAGTPFLGICLGLQLLYKTSEESPGATGLGILDGEILRIPDAPDLKVPQIGWNSLDITPGAKLFAGVEETPICIFCAFVLPEIEGRSRCCSADTLFRGDSCICGKGKCICVSVPSGEEFER